MKNRRDAFIAEYLKDFNGTQAAIRAGYSRRGASVTGHRLLSDANIAAQIRREIEERAMGADEVLQRLAQHARADMGDFLDISTMGFQVDLAKAKELGITHLIKKVKMRTTTSINTNGIETENHEIEIELHDSQDALVQLGRYHKLFTDKQEIKDDTQITVRVKGDDD